MWIGPNGVYQTRLVSAVAGRAARAEARMPRFPTDRGIVPDQNNDRVTDIIRNLTMIHFMNLVNRYSVAAFLERKGNARS